MKTLGLLVGMSWESTIPYYRLINETVRERLGGLHSAKIVLYSVDFHAIERLQQAGAWDEAGHVLASAARVLEAAGADGLVLCTNTMHKVAAAIESAVMIPLLHIADPTAEDYRIVSAAALCIHPADLWQALTIAEQCFHSAQDACQMPIREDTLCWIMDTIPAYWQLIQHQGTVVGSTLLMPTSRAVMTGFVAGSLAEADLFQAVRQDCPHPAACGYWAGTSVLEAHRRRGLALASLIAALAVFVEREQPHPTFYYWAYSALGQRLAHRWRRVLAVRGLSLRRRVGGEMQDRR